MGQDAEVVTEFTGGEVLIWGNVNGHEGYGIWGWGWDNTYRYTVTPGSFLLFLPFILKR